MKILDEQKHLISDLWLDQPGAHKEIDEKIKRGEITAGEGEKLRKFTDEGYTVFSLSDPESVYLDFDAEIERLWADKPADLAVGRRKNNRTSFEDLEDDDRRAGYRLKDPHGHSKTIRHFYLHPEIFRYVELILGQKAIAFQSIYFEFGSEQGLHRDPMFVVTNPPSHLVASWIALHDITEECGPLKYVPGSHRLPWYEFAPDEITAKGPNVKPVDRRRCKEAIERLCAEQNLKERTLVVPRGHVLIWHGNLLHGGSPVTNKEARRKSYVIHYSSLANYKKERTVTQNKQVIVGDKRESRWIRGTTNNVIEQDGCAGMDNPLLHIKEETATSGGIMGLARRILGR